jgi:hypothetical protein
MPVAVETGIAGADCIAVEATAAADMTGETHAQP